MAIQCGGNETLGVTAANPLSVRSINSISQNGALNIHGSASFNAANAVTLNDAGNNFGPVTLVTANNTAAILITEANTLNFCNVTAPGGVTARSSSSAAVCTSATGADHYELFCAATDVGAHFVVRNAILVWSGKGARKPTQK